METEKKHSVLGDCAICIFDISLLARADSSVWDPINVFERLVPRREIMLKRSMLHASHIQQFSRRIPDDAGTVVTVRSKKVISVYDFALGAKDTAIITVNVRPMYDLSSHVANALKEFLEGYATRLSNVDFNKLRMSPLMTALLRHHVKEYLGPEYAAITSRGENSNQNDDETSSSNNNNNDTASSIGTGSYSYYQQSESTGAELISRNFKGNNKNSKNNRDRFAPSDAGNSITSSVAGAVRGNAQPIRFGPPVELLSSSPLSVHILPFGRHAFFPELLERRRNLEMTMQVDPVAWRNVVFPPKLVAAVLRIFVIVLSVPARVILPKLQEVLPGAVEMHYSTSAAANTNLNTLPVGALPPKIQNPKTMILGATNSQYPTDVECGFGLRYFPTMNEAARQIARRTHMICSDAVLVLHYTPHPVLGSRSESPLITEVRAFAAATGVHVVEKVDIQDQHQLLQILGNLAKRFSHIYVVYSDINAFGGTPSNDARMVLTRIAPNKFTLLVDGSYNVGNSCAPSRSHWMNSARNNPGSCCGDVYLVSAGAFLPTVIGRACFAVYCATKCIIDVESCLQDPLTPLLIDDAIVVQMELVKAMTAQTLQTETHRAAVGLSQEAKERLARVVPQNLSPTVSSGIICIPVPHLKAFAMTPGLRGGRRHDQKGNEALFLTAGVAKQLENVGVTCAFALVNLVPIKMLNSRGQADNSLLATMSSLDSEEGGVLCAVMTPHLQTIEQVSWNLVWQVLATAGQSKFHPDKVPTLAPAPDEADMDNILAEKKKLSLSKTKLEEDKTQQEKDDAELLNLIRLVMGDNNKDVLDDDDKTLALELREGDRSGETDYIARDPYSYTSRLDNLFAQFDPSRALSGYAIMNGIVESASQSDDGFMGYYFSESGEQEAELHNPNSVSRLVNRSFSPLSSTVSSSLRREVIEAAYLARMVLRYGKEPADNAPVLIAEVLKDFAPQNQFDKFSILIEAYRGKEHQLLDSLIERLVPPHKRGLFRPRAMLLRAPPVPDADVALARRMIYKCLVAHRPKRTDEISSLAHLLAPLITLVHQRGQPKQNLKSNPLGLLQNNGSPSPSGVTMDYLKEEETFGVLVRRILEEEIGIVPRAVGSRIGGDSGDSPNRDFSRRSRSSSPVSTRKPGSKIFDGPAGENLSPAMQARLNAAKIQERRLEKAIAIQAENEKLGINVQNSKYLLQDDLLDDEQPNFVYGNNFNNNNSGRSHSFLDQMFKGVGGGGRGRDETGSRSPTRNHNHGNNNDEVPAFFHHKDPNARSASLALSAAQRVVSGGRSASGFNSQLSRSSSSSNPTLARNYLYDDDEHAPYEHVGGPFSGQVKPPSIRERVMRIYARYEPSKMPFVDDVLQTWSGREELLIAALRTKYGDEPPYATPIRNFNRPQHLTDPKVERPGNLVNVVRDFYHATGGAGARAVIDEALEVAFPLEQTAARVFKKMSKEEADRQKLLDAYEEKRLEKRQQQGDLGVSGSEIDFV